MSEGPPFRADHVGSLLRPNALLEARARHVEGVIDDEQLRAAEDEAIRDVIRVQESIGLRSATDGEFRRQWWQMDFAYALGGTAPTRTDHTATWQGDEGEREWGPPGLAVVDRITLERPIFADAFAFLRDNVTTATAKLTIPSPNVIAALVKATGDSVYDDQEALSADLTTAYAKEIASLAELGCTYLQFDDTRLAHLNDPRSRESIFAAGGDPSRELATAIANVNRALADRPPGMTITTHLCRGNYRSMWRSRGGYDFVAETLFNELDVDGFFLEFDDERSGTFEPLRFVPSGKRVVLGLVTTKRPHLEQRDQLMRRIEEASRYVPIEQLCVSPQCGFASTQEGNVVTHEDQVAKLRLVVETATEVWGP